MAGTRTGQIRTVAVTVLLACWPGPGHTDEPPAPFDVSAAQVVAGHMDADPRLAAIFAMCPADAFKRDAPFYALWTNPKSNDEGLCGASPDVCYRQCVDDADAGACFGLGRAFQLNDAAVDERHTQTLFALACDAGMGSGCTNRASSLRNAPVEDEPLQRLSRAEQEDCEHRSFRIGCTQGDPWSCAMLGQSYQLGEGVAASPAQARSFFERSCSLSPEFVACDFAKAGLAALKRR